MTFDKNKVYTALNADEVKVGSKGYFADNLFDLQYKLSNNEHLEEVTNINPDCDRARFVESCDEWILFYLVEEPEEEKYRPYKNNAELLEDFRNRMLGSAYWIVDKNSDDKYLITGFIKEDTNTYCVLIGTCFVSLEVLFKSYTYLDGSPCGKKIRSVTK